MSQVKFEKSSLSTTLICHLVNLGSLVALYRSLPVYSNFQQSPDAGCDMSDTATRDTHWLNGSSAQLLTSVGYNFN